jgi:hypothetical protein
MGPVATYVQDVKSSAIFILKKYIKSENGAL